MFNFVMALCLNPTHAQLQHERKGIVEKEALIVYLVGGQNVLIPEPPPIPDTVDSRGNVIKRFSGGSSEDYFTYRLLPNDRKLPDGRPIPIELHFRDLVTANQGIYLFNDVYLSPSLMSSPDIYGDLGLNPSDYSSPVINMDSLKVSNDVFIWYDKSYVAKFWVLKGEWEEFELTEKPQILRALTRHSLQFENYGVHFLKKIISIEPVTKVESSIYIEAKKGLIPATKPRPKN